MTNLQSALPCFDVFVERGNVYFTMHKTEAKNKTDMSFDFSEDMVFFSPLSLQEFLVSFRTFFKGYYKVNKAKINKCIKEKDEDDLSDAIYSLYEDFFWSFCNHVQGIQLNILITKYDTFINLRVNETEIKPSKDCNSIHSKQG